MLTRLGLLDFRCYESLQLTLPEQGAVFLGQNAAGKTTLLEAMCVLLRLQSPRTSRMAPLIHHGKKMFGVSGTLNQVKRRFIWKDKVSELAIGGDLVSERSRYLSESGLVVWVGNEDMSLVRGSAEGRRRYLDFLGTQWSSQYRWAYLRYRQALKARNVLLKRTHPDLTQLDAYTTLMVEHGTVLMDKRRQLVDILSPYVEQEHFRIGGGREHVSLNYKASAKIPLKQLWSQSLSRDLILGQTQSGPHRDDMELLLEGHPAAPFTSEGQQRTMALALKLAQHSLLVRETGKMPLLLLDDIFGELDLSRRTALMDGLPKGGQVFITTTHLDWLSDKKSMNLPVFSLNEGKIVLQ